MKKIKVRSTSGTYEIWCGRGVAAKSARAVARLAEQSSLFLISSLRVWKHMGARIERIFKGVHRATILLDDREAAKNLSTVEKACRQLVRAGADRRALLVAVGGGVCCGKLRSRNRACAHSHDARGAGGQRHWGQNRGKSSGREKPGRSVLPCETCDCRS